MIFVTTKVILKKTVRIILQKIIVVKRLPKTRSGKILRKTLRSMSDGLELVIPSTIEDLSLLNEIKEKIVLYELGKSSI